MLPPGRRRDCALSPLMLCLAIFTLFASTASAASSVLGIDFGTLNFKAALVKPGIPLEIVLSKDSKRKETAAVAFKPQRDGKNNIVAEVGTFPERIYGSDALALQGRMPGEVFPNLKPLLGLPWAEKASEVVEWYQERYPALQVRQVREMGTTVIKSSAFAEGEMPWSVEELLAMELANVKGNAEAMAGKGHTVGDAVITVPAFYTADERRAIERAAKLAGLNVMSLISEGLAVGLDYAKSRVFPTVNEGGKPEHHLVFDMGAGSTTATLLRMQGRSVKDVGRFNKTIQEVTVLGTGWDRTLGGDAMNQLIVDDYIRKFSTKPVLKSRGTAVEEIARNARLMSRVWKDAEKARQVLSANSETSSSFEELLPDVDFRTKLSRTQFEELASSFADRVAGPIEDALSAAKLGMKDIDSVILHGGAVRTPFVQKKLEEIAGSAKLRSNVNADESAVFGAAFKGAGLSPSFKVKEIRDTDIAGYAIGMTYTDISSGKERKQGLFTATSPVGNGAATKQITFKDKEDFVFNFYQTIGEVDRGITRIQTENLTAGVQELKDKFGCEKDDISTKFSIKLSPVDGLPEAMSGTVSCETEAEAKSMGDSVKDWFGFGKKKGEQEPLMDGEDGSESTEEVDAESATTSSATGSGSSSSSSSSDSSSSSKAPEKPKKRTESITIAFSVSSLGNPQPSPMEMQRMQDRLAAFDGSDKARYAREEAQNVLESYTYFVRDFLGNDIYTEVSTQAQRDDISKLLDSTREFMEGSEVAKATKETLTQKTKALKKLVEPIQARKREEQARPEKLEGLRSSLAQMDKMIEMVQEQLARASSASEEFLKSASETVAAASETVTSAASSVADGLDDLEEPESSTSTTKAPAATPAFVSPYTEEDMTGIKKVYSSVHAWLEEKESEQSKLKPYEDPVLSVKAMEAKATELSNIMTDLLYKKMQTPKSSSTKKAKTSKTRSGKKSSSSKTKSSSGADSSVTDVPPAANADDAQGSESYAKRKTVDSDDEMPSEEEILQMIKDSKGKEGQGRTRPTKHDEL